MSTFVTFAATALAGGPVQAELLVRLEEPFEAAAGPAPGPCGIYEGSVATPSSLFLYEGGHLIEQAYHLDTLLRKRDAGVDELPPAHRVPFEADERGRLLRVHWTRFTYPPDVRVTKAPPPFLWEWTAAVRSDGLDPRGVSIDPQWVEVTDGTLTWVRTLDASGRVVSEGPVDSPSRVTYAWEGDRLVSALGPQGEIATFQTDALGRVTSAHVVIPASEELLYLCALCDGEPLEDRTVSVPVPGYSRDLEWTWDAQGHLLRFGARWWEYDAWGNLARSGGEGGERRYGYGRWQGPIEAVEAPG